MAEGWVLVVGVAALLGTIALAGVILRAIQRPQIASEGLLALGPALIVLGIIFGTDPIVGYAFIGAGVVVSILATMLRRSPAA